MADLNTYAYNELYISDLHKEARGWRCRIDFNDGQWTKAKVDSFYDSLIEEVGIAAADEKRQESDALVAFNNHIAKLMDDHGISQEDAIRWDVQAENGEILTERDADYYFWQKGLGFEDRQPFVALVLSMKETA